VGKLIICWFCLIVGAIALARGLYLHQQLKAHLDTGMLGAIRSSLLVFSAENRAIVDWYRSVTPWLIGVGVALLIIGVLLALSLPHGKSEKIKRVKNGRKPS
jgi:drug/metabolite transporter (DMT)-like permease